MRRYSSREAYSNLIEAIKIMPRPLTKLSNHAEQLSEITFSPDGKYLATLSNGELWMNKVDTLNTGSEIGEAKSLSPSGERITRVAFSPDGAYMAAARKGGVRLWLTKTMKELAPINGSPAVLFGGGKNLIAVVDDARGDVVHVWRPEGEGAREVASATVGGKVSDVGFMADSPFFITLVHVDEEKTRLDFWHTNNGHQTKPAAEPVDVKGGSKFTANAK